MKAHLLLLTIMLMMVMVIGVRARMLCFKSHLFAVLQETDDVAS